MKNFLENTQSKTKTPCMQSKKKTLIAETSNFTFLFKTAAGQLSLSYVPSSTVKLINQQA